MSIEGIRKIQADRLDEDTFRSAGLAGASGLALLHQDDVGNIHAALCAQGVVRDVPIVMRMFNTGLGYRIKPLLHDCEVLSDAAMAAPAFVAGALGEVDPTHFRHFGRTFLVARRADVDPKTVVCGLARLRDGDDPVELPEDEENADLVLAEATGRPPAATLTARRVARAQRWRRIAAVGPRAVQSFATRKIGIATFAVLALVVVFGALLYSQGDNAWKAIYLTLLTTISGADPDPETSFSVQIMQVVLTVAGLALIPLITAAVVDGIVNARLALDSGQAGPARTSHIVVVSLGNVGTRIVRRLTDLGIDVVAIDKSPDARGSAIIAQLGVPFIVGDAAREETLRQAWVDTSRAVVIVSTDDVTNLQAALHARAVQPGVPVVLRLFDGDLADRIREKFDIGVSHSVSYLAAPAFAAALLDREVIATIPVERHVLLVAEVPVSEGSPLVGRTFGSVSRPGSVRVIARRRSGADAPDYSARRTDVVAAGDRITVVTRKDELSSLLTQASAPSGPPAGKSRAGRSPAGAQPTRPALSEQIPAPEEDLPPFDDDLATLDVPPDQPAQSDRSPDEPVSPPPLHAPGGVPTQRRRAEPPG
jgi:Trk K+ transport system NAD-binding subunit